MQNSFNRENKFQEDVKMFQLIMNYFNKKDFLYKIGAIFPIEK